MKFANFTLEMISPKYYQLLFNYYNGNKNHLELWEPTRIDNYYTLEFHINRTNKRLQLMDEKNLCILSCLIIQKVKYWECVIIQKLRMERVGWDTQYLVSMRGWGLCMKL